MIIRLSLVLALLILIINLAWAVPFKPMNIPIAEERKSKVTVLNGNGKMKKGFYKQTLIPSFEVWRTEKIYKDGKSYYQVKEQSKLFNGQSLETTSFVEIGEYLKPISFNSLNRNTEGKEIKSFEIRFDDKSWDHPDDIYSTSMIPLIFRALIDQNIKKTNFHIWLADFAVFQMKLMLIGKENINVPMGEFTCFKIIMEPDIRKILPIGEFFAIFVQPFMPEFYFWFWEKEPYPLVKFEGSLGPPGSPKSISELINYKEV